MISAKYPQEAFLFKFTQETFSEALDKKSKRVFKKEIEEMEREKELRLAKEKLCDEKFKIFHDGLCNIIENIINLKKTDKVVTSTLDLSVADFSFIKEHDDYNDFIGRLKEKYITICYIFDDVNNNSNKVTLSFKFDFDYFNECVSIYDYECPIMVSPFVE